MATRTPPLQPRAQFHRNWGNFATAAGLPNAAGLPLGAGPFAALEVGDEAYAIAEAATYTCTAVGTVGGGDAVWTAAMGGGPTLIPGVRGFTVTDYLSATAGSFPGVGTGCTFALLARPRRQDPGDEVLFSNANSFANHSGVIIGHLASFGYYFSLGDGVGSTQFIIGPANTVFANAGKLTLIHGVYTGTDVRGYANGSRTPGSVPQAFAASGLASLLGLGPFSLLPAEEFDILGIGYIEQAFTDDDAFEHWHACAASESFAQGTFTWDEFNGGNLVAGTLPSQVGGTAFAEVGTLTDTDVPVVWR